jgi:hypothetical protein
MHTKLLSRQHNINDLVSEIFSTMRRNNNNNNNNDDNMASEEEKFLLKLFINSSVSRSKVDK